MGSNLLAGLGALGGNFASWVVPVLFTLTIIVFFHELGHFLVARFCGIKVLVFSIGFGPELVGFYDRRGTRWKISAIPLGGYVKFFGDENEASVPDAGTLAAMTEDERKRSFPGQPAAAAGFKVGDVIVSIDGTQIDNFGDVQRIATFSPGVTLTLDVARRGSPS